MCYPVNIKQERYCGEEMAYIVPIDSRKTVLIGSSGGGTDNENGKRRSSPHWVRLPSFVVGSLPAGLSISNTTVKLSTKKQYTERFTEMYGKVAGERMANEVEKCERNGPVGNEYITTLPSKIKLTKKLTREQRKHRDSLLWLFGRGPRRSGRTTLMCSAMIDLAVASRGQEIKLIDHTAMHIPDAQYRICKDVVLSELTELIDPSELKNFRIDTLKLTIRYTA